MSWPKTLLQLRRILRLCNVRVVNVHFPNLVALSFVMLRWLGLYDGKIILSFHGTEIRYATQAAGFERSAWRMLLRSADACVAVSGNLGSVVADICQRANIVKVHNGIDIAAFLAERDAEFKIEPRLLEQPYILCIAQFVQWKGHDTLLHAFAETVAEFPHLRLILIGGTGPFAETVRHEIIRLGLDERVFIIEGLPHSRIASFLEHATLVALPSRKEGLPLVPLEASAFGLPVVAPSVGGTPEIIADGESGRLVPSDDPGALRAAIVDLLRSPPEARRLGENLRRRVATDFTWAAAYQQYMRVARA